MLAPEQSWTLDAFAAARAGAHRGALVPVAVLGVGVSLLAGAHWSYERLTAPEIERVLPADARLESSWTEWEEPLLSFDNGADHRLVASMSRESFREYARRLDLDCERSKGTVTCSRTRAGWRYDLPEDLLFGEAHRGCGMDCEAELVAARWSYGRAHVRQFHTFVYW